MSSGSTSSTDGKQDGPWGHRVGSRFPMFGRTAARLLQSLDEAAGKPSGGEEPPVNWRKERDRMRHASKKPENLRHINRGKVFLAVAGTLVVVSLITGFIVAIYMVRPTESLPAPEGILQTRIQMKGFELAVRSFWATYQRMPDGTMPEVLAVLAGSNADGQNPECIIYMSLREPEHRFGRVVKHGDTDEQGNYLDGWGRPMDLNIVHAEKRMYLKSFGPNGKDEGGGGDDIVMTVIPNL